jgi:hypothetical protein
MVMVDNPKSEAGEGTKFKKVVQHFLKTPPEKHKPAKAKKPRPKPKPDK